MEEYSEIYDNPPLVRNCVYKIIAEDGHYKIGHTTNTLCERYSRYLRNKKDSIYPYIKDKKVRFQILYQGLDEELFDMEQFEIYKHISRELGDKVKHHNVLVLSTHFNDNGLKICNQKFDYPERTHRYMIVNNLY